MKMKTHMPIYRVYHKKHIIDSIVAYPFESWGEYVWSDYSGEAGHKPYQYDILQLKKEDDKSWIIYQTVSP